MTADLRALGRASWPTCCRAPCCATSCWSSAPPRSPGSAPRFSSRCRSRRCRSRCRPSPSCCPARRWDRGAAAAAMLLYLVVGQRLGVAWFAEWRLRLRRSRRSATSLASWWRRRSSARWPAAAPTARSWARSAIMVVGNLIIYAIGVPWLMARWVWTCRWAWSSGVSPFLIGDGAEGRPGRRPAAGSPGAWSAPASREADRRFETLGRPCRLGARPGHRRGGPADPDEHHLQAGCGRPDARAASSTAARTTPPDARWRRPSPCWRAPTHGFAYASGLAATQNLLYLTEPGQRILMCDDVYGGTWRLADKVWSRYGVAVGAG